VYRTQSDACVFNFYNFLNEAVRRTFASLDGLIGQDQEHQVYPSKQRGDRMSVCL
jgi:hypothetical protein